MAAHTRIGNVWDYPPPPPVYQKNENISFAPAFADSNEPRKLSAIHDKKAPHLRCILHYIAGFASSDREAVPTMTQWRHAIVISVVQNWRARTRPGKLNVLKRILVH